MIAFFGLSIPWFYASFGVILTFVGCLAAWNARVAVLKESRRLRSAENRLTAAEAWQEAYTPDQVEFSKWMRESGVERDSHLSDYFRSCWAAWIGGRAVSLSELHQLVSRRERSRRTARISGGIATLLLVVGILGTLFSIHPVLKDFQLPMNPSGELTPEELSESTEKVNSLISNLGDAFFPSLVALLGTVLVVSCRGLYSYQLNRFVLELDSFAVDFLIPKFRPATITDQFRDVKEIFVGLSDSISEREGKFEGVVEQLNTFVEKVGPAVEAISAAASSLNLASEVSQKSAETLSSRSQSISNGITRHLGKRSPMYKAISGFEDIFSRTESTLEKLAELVEEQGEGNRADRKELTMVIESLEKAVGQISDDHETDRKSSREAADDLKKEVEKLPKQIDSKAKEAIEAGISAIEEQLRSLQEDQKQEGEKLAKEIRDELLLKIEEISESAAILPDQIEQLQKVIDGSREITEESIATIKSNGDLTEENIKESLKRLDEVSEVLEQKAANLNEKLSNAIDRAEENREKEIGSLLPAENIDRPTEPANVPKATLSAKVTTLRPSSVQLGSTDDVDDESNRQNEEAEPQLGKNELPSEREERTKGEKENEVGEVPEVVKKRGLSWFRRKKR